MKLLHILLALIPLIPCPRAFGLPGIISGDQIEGRVDKIVKMRQPVLLAGACSVVHLTEASGIDRDKANNLLRLFRRTGYEPTRKTLRDHEIIIVLTEAQAAKVRIGARIRITKYSVWIGDETKTLINVKLEDIDTIKQIAEQVISPNAR